MTSRERVHHTIDRKGVDRVPYSFDITSHIAGRAAAYFGIPAERLHSFIKDDLLYVGARAEVPQPDWVKADQVFNEFGVLREMSARNSAVGDWGVILRHPLPEPELGDYRFPDGGDPGLFAHLNAAGFDTENRFVTLSMTGLFDLCWNLRGFENFMMDMAGEEAFAAELLDRALGYNLEAIAQIPDCVDGVRVGEDWGLQEGLIMGGRLWRKHLKPRLSILYDAIRGRGKRVMIHCCGDIAELFPDLIELGVEVIHPIQPEAMDIAFLHREYGRDVTMYGGLGSQSTLVYGNPSDILAEVRDRLNLFADGGYILGPAGAIPTDARLDTVIALMDWVMGQG